MKLTHHLTTVLGTMIALLGPACGGGDETGARVDPEPEPLCFDSTFAAIQANIFEARGCTQSACHGEAAEGGLDLREGAAHEQLVYAASTVDSGMMRVNPGEPDLSLLYRKLQAKISGQDLGVLGQAMPVAADPLTDDELEAVRLWIRKGANQDQVIDETMSLLGCDQTFDPVPDKIQPLPSPDPDVGVQFYSGGWTLPAESEDEVCFVTHYDFSDAVPDDARVDCPPGLGAQECFAFGDHELAQDAQSHHSIIDAYMVLSDPNDPSWGAWTCLGGDRDGEPCDPSARAACGDRSQCATEVVTGSTCNQYPYAPDLFRRTATVNMRRQFTGAQESRFISQAVDGVYTPIPVSGFVAWNSHAFNLTKQDTTIEQWVNVRYRFKADQRWPEQIIFDLSQIYAMDSVQPFQKKEICMTFTLPQFSRLTYLSSHMHARGKRFRIWHPPQEVCSNGVIGCSVPADDADYESRIYDDPLYQYYPPTALPAFDEVDKVSRTFKACAVFDNGADNPFEVKRHSTRPDAFTCGLARANCGCEPEFRACFGGDDQGRACGGDDAVCGAEGLCDACPLFGGITTDDEMFIPLGAYYVETPE